MFDKSNFGFFGQGKELRWGDVDPFTQPAHFTSPKEQKVVVICDYPATPMLVCVSNPAPINLYFAYFGWVRISVSITTKSVKTFLL